MAHPSEIMSLIEKLHSIDARLIELEARVDKNEKAIRANKEKGWFAYDRTQEHETEIEDIVRRIDILEEAEENRE